MTLEGYFSALGPELILLIGACVVLMVGLTRASKWVATVTLLTVAVSLMDTIHLGEPSGGAMPIGLWITPLTFYTRCVSLSLGLLFILVNWHQPVAQERGEYMAMILLSLLGVLMTSSANDLVVLFFAVELVSIPTYVLVAMSREDTRASEAAVKYFFLGAMAAAIFAYGLSFLYGAMGTTTMYSMVMDVGVSNGPMGDKLGSAALIGLLLVFGGLAFKVAAVPFHVYAADVYEGASSPVTGLLGFIPKFAGFIALIKICALFHWTWTDSMFWMIWVVAAATMTIGNVLALLQQNVKRMLAYSSIAHTGYMFIALLVGPVAGFGPMSDGIAALLFYIAVYGAMNLGVFALLTIYKNGDRDLETLEELGGLAIRSPLAALMLAICVFSLMGLPPTAGFLGKLYIFSSAFSLYHEHPRHGPMIALAIIGVVNAAIASAYYLRIAAAIYMGREMDRVRAVSGIPVRVGLGLCSVAMLVLFVWPIGLVEQANRATAVVRQSIATTSGQVTSTSNTSMLNPTKVDAVTDQTAIQSRLSSLIQR